MNGWAGAQRDLTTELCEGAVVVSGPTDTLTLQISPLYLATT